MGVGEPAGWAGPWKGPALGRGRLGWGLADGGGPCRWAGGRRGRPAEPGSRSTSWVRPAGGWVWWSDEAGTRPPHTDARCLHLRGSGVRLCRRTPPTGPGILPVVPCDPASVRHSPKYSEVFGDADAGPRPYHHRSPSQRWPGPSTHWDSAAPPVRVFSLQEEPPPHLPLAEPKGFASFHPGDPTGFLQLQRTGSSLRWLLSLRSTGCRCVGPGSCSTPA
ncbi:uncharacterized protein LOC112586269 isoform X2 [Bubalus bubalis]|uniref:uncharacterized protein LOC112586269 isoform X2 n=1 Tax=Bubalus bubalis TaxID=89462 RepID=UPI001D126C01|nr:uncharacterized protein LOC112586269 isoform X2 [Bubalus bubalis]